MDNPESSTLMSLVKIEDEYNKVKREPVADDDPMDLVQVEDSLSMEETFAEHEISKVNDSFNSSITFPGMDLSQRDSIIHYSKMEMGTKRRLRFSEADDMLLLRRVAALNPYKCSALWKEVTNAVAVRADKNFSVRSVREHTDLVMNTFSLRGPEACLRRTPPELWERKKQLLQTVYNMWKKDTYPVRSSTTEGGGSKKLKIDSAADSASKVQIQSLKVDNQRNNLITLENNPTHPAVSVSSKPSASLLVTSANVPLGIPMGSTLPSFPHLSIMARVLPPVMQPLLVNSQVGSKEVPTSNDFPSPMVMKPISSNKILDVASENPPDVVVDAMSSDQLIPHTATTTSSQNLSETISVPVRADQSVSPIPLQEILLAGKNSVATQCGDGESQSCSSVASVDSCTSAVHSEVYDLEQRTDSIMFSRRWKISTMMRKRLSFIQKRHRDQYFLKRREIDLERRRLALQERKISLEERKLQMEEEKWQFDKKEREEKLLIMAEEQEHKIAMEKRQQNMIDVLLELRKKE